MKTEARYTVKIRVAEQPFVWVVGTGDTISTAMRDVVDRIRCDPMVLDSMLMKIFDGEDLFFYGQKHTY